MGLLMLLLVVMAASSHLEGTTGRVKKARIIRVPFTFAKDTSLPFSSDLVCVHSGLLQTKRAAYKRRLQSVTGWRLHPQFSQDIMEIRNKVDKRTDSMDNHELPWIPNDLLLNDHLVRLSSAES